MWILFPPVTLHIVTRRSLDQICQQFSVSYQIKWNLLCFSFKVIHILFCLPLPPTLYPLSPNTHTKVNIMGSTQILSSEYESMITNPISPHPNEFINCWWIKTGSLTKRGLWRKRRHSPSKGCPETSDWLWDPNPCPPWCHRDNFNHYHSTTTPHGIRWGLSCNQFNLPASWSYFLTFLQVYILRLLPKKPSAQDTLSQTNLRPVYDGSGGGPRKYTLTWDLEVDHLAVSCHGPLCAVAFPANSFPRHKLRWDVGVETPGWCNTFGA